jgi:hypothetical protein
LPEEYPQKGGVGHGWWDLFLKVVLKGFGGMLETQEGFSINPLMQFLYVVFLEIPEEAVINFIPPLLSLVDAA